MAVQNVVDHYAGDVQGGGPAEPRNGAAAQHPAERLDDGR